MQDLQDFLLPVDTTEILGDEPAREGELGHHILQAGDEDFHLAEIVILGLSEMRGGGTDEKENDAADCVRRELYRLNYWHTDIKIGDAGNVKTGASLRDSYAAARTAIRELYAQNKVVLLIGGSHDLTIAQYEAFRDSDKLVEATGVDARIDLGMETPVPAEKFLMEIFTEEPNMLKHYNHVGFQSYYVHPRMLETIDKLRFDCYRLGHVQEFLEEMEPVFRNSNLVSFDISAIKHSDAPANKQSPNGLSGTEACTLARFAGMSGNLESFGIYGYSPANDISSLTAKQIAQMCWYFIDGRHRLLQEASLEERQHFNEFHTVFAEVDTTFLQNKKTNRWWMQMPDGKFVACSQKDYLTAGKNDFPERWLRTQERN